MARCVRIHIPDSEFGYIALESSCLGDKEVCIDLGEAFKTILEFFECTPEVTEISLQTVQRNTEKLKATIKRLKINQAKGDE